LEFQPSLAVFHKHIRAIVSDDEFDEKVVGGYQLQTNQHGTLEDKIQTKEMPERRAYI
jgi:hypothetical protein